MVQPAALALLFSEVSPALMLTQAISNSAPFSEPCECQAYARPRVEVSEASQQGWLKARSTEEGFGYCDRRRYLGGITHCHVPANAFTFMFSQT